ncbi:uncharacterized protein [Amphiura filiformis]|uniref:uncharacterized protein n=1 Tax=Amphiura filiformis TaxID=82378 RepID=UPI003B216008
MAWQSKQEERHFIFEWIQVYRELPALWKFNSKEYRDQNQKNAAYDILLAKYRERYPQATKEDAKNKINSLRTNYRKALKKAQDSARSDVGAGVDEFNKPSLWYFDAMSFLQDHLQTPATSRSTIEVKAEVREEEDDVVDVVESQVAVTCPDNRMGQQSTPIYKPKNSMKRKTTKNDDPREELLSLACKRLSQHDNEHLQLAKAWANELSKMDPQQQVFAKKGINDILFEGQMGTLHRHSIQINAPGSTIHF